MFKKFTTRELVLIAVMVASLFVINLVLGSGIVAATGIPLANNFVDAILIGIWMSVTIRLVPKLGTVTLFSLIYSILELPTALGGAPGFWPKIPINTLSGLVGDVVIYLINYKEWSFYITFAVVSVANFFAFAFFLWLLKLPGVDTLIAYLPMLIAIYIVLGSVGIFIGRKIYQRIKEKRIVKQIQS